MGCDENNATGTPPPKKLGIKDGHRVVIDGEPDGIAVDLLGPGERVETGPADVIVAFHTKRAELERALPRLRALMQPAAALWIAWPKKAAKTDTDITEDVVRELALSMSSPSLVDNKVCAIDATWSGLRLVIRLKDR